MTQALEGLGWDGSWATAFSQAPESDAVPGRVAGPLRRRVPRAERGPRAPLRPVVLTR